MQQRVETEFKLWEDFVLASIDGSCWREFSGFLEELILANQTGSPPLIHPFLAPPPVYNHYIQDITIMELFTLRICAINTARLALYDKAQKRGSLKEFGLIVPVNEQQTYFVKKMMNFRVVTLQQLHPCQTTNLCNSTFYRNQVIFGYLFICRSFLVKQEVKYYLYICTF